MVMNIQTSKSTLLLFLVTAICLMYQAILALDYYSYSAYSTWQEQWNCLAFRHRPWLGWGK